jgi:short-subunit dehydrogenase
MKAQAAIVTGASSGISREYTRMLFSGGYRVPGVELKAEAV